MPVGSASELESTARFLFETMERLDPGEDALTDWCDLPERDREFYRLCVSTLVRQRGRALVSLLSDNDVVPRHPHKRE